MWRPKTGAVHLVPGVRAGDSIATDPSSSLRTVRGTVTDGDGATVAVIQRTFVNADGGGGLVDSGPPATCDEKGRFELPIVPRAGAALRVTLASGLSYLVPVERIGEETEVELQAPDASILDVRTDYLAEAHTLHVEDAAGRILPVWTLRAGGAGAFREVVESEGGRFPLTHVPPSAAVAVVTRPDGSHSELPFTPTPGGLVPVRLR